MSMHWITFTPCIAIMLYRSYCTNELDKRQYGRKYWTKGFEISCSTRLIFFFLGFSKSGITHAFCFHFQPLIYLCSVIFVIFSMNRAQFLITIIIISSKGLIKHKVNWQYKDLINNLMIAIYNVIDHWWQFKLEHL